MSVCVFVCTQVYEMTQQRLTPPGLTIPHPGLGLGFPFGVTVPNGHTQPPWARRLYGPGDVCLGACEVSLRQAHPKYSQGPAQDNRPVQTLNIFMAVTPSAAVTPTLLP